MSLTPYCPGCSSRKHWPGDCPQRVHITPYQYRPSKPAACTRIVQPRDMRGDYEYRPSTSVPIEPDPLAMFAGDGADPGGSADLPAPVDGARLPQTYQAAQAALAECERVDECRSWADRAAALGSYARQAKDDSLQRLADRIHARAVRRCGELLGEIAPAPGARTDLQPSDGGVTRLKKRAAREAGLSERQRVTATRVANVPVDEFEAAVEADRPATVTELAQRGKRAGRPRPERTRKHPDCPTCRCGEKGGTSDKGRVEIVAPGASGGEVSGDRKGKRAK